MNIFKDGGLLDNLKNYIATRVELAKVTAQEEIIALMQRLAPLLGLGFLAALAFVFFMVGLASYFNQLLESTFWGYWIVSLLLLIILAALGYGFGIIPPKKKQ
jgi:hypothetical protein